eukprot:scaffold139975_cov127-Phaeocystis_antarctica.AAC.3
MEETSNEKIVASGNEEVVTLASLPDEILHLVIAACDDYEDGVPLFEAVKGLGCVSKGMRQQLHGLQPLVGVLSLAVVQRPARGPWRVTLLYDGELTEEVMEQARQGRVHSVKADDAATLAPHTTLAPAVANRVVPELMGAGCSLVDLDMSFVKLDSTWVLAFGGAAVCSAMLRTLRLAGCALRGPLPELGRLPALQVLNLAGNQLMRGLEPLRDCTALRDLDLGNNKLKGGLESLRGCTALQVLNLSNNRLTGGLEPLRGCTALRELTLFSNFLTGGLDPLRACKALWNLDLGRNLLTGGLEPLRGCTALLELDVGNNQLAPASDEDKAHFKAQCGWEEGDDTDSDSESEG